MSARSYRLLGRIGKGGMAEVHLAVAVGADGFERRVAVKRIVAGRDESDSFRKMFVDEAKIASQLHHAGIVGVFDYGIMDLEPFQVLEYVEGADLAYLLGVGRTTGEVIPLGVALHIANEVALALDYAHRAKALDGTPLEIVHRDVSPANVLISRTGEVKLSDFGIAKANIRSEKTVTGVAKGKMTYMSPEQMLGADVDCRADVFSLGVTLHAMLAGESPLREQSNVARLMAGFPAVLASSLDPEVAVLIARSMAPNRQDRYSSAADFADALSDLAAKHAPNARKAMRQWLSTLERCAPPLWPVVSMLPSGEQPVMPVLKGSKPSLSLVLDETARVDARDAGSAALAVAETDAFLGRASAEMTGGRAPEETPPEAATLVVKKAILSGGGLAEQNNHPLGTPPSTSSSSEWSPGQVAAFSVATATHVAAESAVARTTPRFRPKWIAFGIVGSLLVGTAWVWVTRVSSAPSGDVAAGPDRSALGGSVVAVVPVSEAHVTPAVAATDAALIFPPVADAAVVVVPTHSADRSSRADRVQRALAQPVDIQPPPAPPPVVVTPVAPRPAVENAPSPTEPVRSLDTGVLVIGGAGARTLSIYVDGVLRGRGARQLILPVGTHRVRLLTPDGLELSSRTFDVQLSHTSRAPLRWLVDE